MNILVLHGGVSAVDYHRLIIPFNRIAHLHPEWTFYQAGNIDEATAEDIKAWGINVVIFSRNISPNFNPHPAFTLLKAFGIKIVIDIDDYWYLPKNHYLNPFYQRYNISLCIEHQIMMADYVITTHRHLLNTIGTVRPAQNVIIAPNGIDPSQDQFRTDLLTYDYENIYWQGGLSHRYDIQELKGAFDGLLDYKFTLAGYGDNKIWHDMLSAFKGDNLEYNLARPVHEYAIDYYDKGICVVPIIDNKFNRLKSEIKAIEAGWFCKPVIVNNLYPYTKLIVDGKNGLLINNKQEWGTKIKGLLSNHRLQDDLRYSLNETVKARHHIDKVNESRIQLLQTICQKG